jgi:predicted ABC-type ATPase
MAYLLISPQGAEIKAGKLMLQRIKLLADEKRTFGFETTLSGETIFSLLQRLKKRNIIYNFFSLV